jgi:hypothetical protein
MRIILCVLACIVLLLWIGPGLWVLLGSYLFYMLLLGLALTAGESHWPWYLTAPLICAFLGGTWWAVICVMRRSRHL